MITEESIERLKQMIDIADVVGSYLELTKSGASFKALCPFHGEKTPSLIIHPQKGFYHCFGCGASGDAIKFVMEYEKLTYPEAIEKIAGLYNVSLSYTDVASNAPKSSLLEKLSSFYQKRLESEPNALEYLKSRSVHTNMIERFEIGYAPASSETLRFLEGGFFSQNEALELGALAEENGRLYARFIDRLTFPIYAPNRKLVGFGGRTMGNHPAKYINSPQTKLFNKSKLLYGYPLAKEAILKEGKIIVTEGYLDVILLHQAGFSYAVATLGTALTLDHLPLLSKGEPKILLSYDGDKAGIAAALKASRLLANHGKEGGVVLFSGGLDPADMVAQKRIEELNRLFLRPTPFVEFVLQKSVESYDLSSPLQKEAALKECGEFLRTLSPLLQEEYKPLLASLLKIPASLIRTVKSPRHPLAPPKEGIGAGGSELAEASLIKTILEQPRLLEFVLEYLDSEVFGVHQAEFELLKLGEFEHPKLLRILLQERIHPLEESVLKEQLRLMLRHFYSKKLKEIAANKSLDFKIRAFWLGKIRVHLEKLEKGGLVPYESFGAL